MKYILLIIMTCFSFSFLDAQEICTNGIDDDNDGLIDLNDDDCICTQEIHYLYDESFEAKDCCPQTFTVPEFNPDGLDINCLSIWERANLASADFFDTCGFIGTNTFGSIVIPLPMPLGEGAVGFGSWTDWNEYIGQCVETTIPANDTYQVELYYATNSNAHLEIGIFGNPSCINFPLNTLFCPSGLDTSWVVLATHFLDASLRTWKKVSFTMTPNIDINTIVFGSSCAHNDIHGSALSGHYTFIDDFKIFLPGDLFVDNISSTEDCPNIVLQYPQDPGLTYQWYLNGVAIAGETTPKLVVEPGQTGDYSIRIDNSMDCAISDTYEVDQFPELTSITGSVSHVHCYGGADGRIDLLLPSDHPPYDILWDGGQSDSLLTNLQVGDYAVTVKDDLGCTQELAFMVVQPDSMTIESQVFQPSCPNGDDAGIKLSISGGSQPYFYFWSNGETTSEIVGLSAETFFVHIIDSNNCSISDTFTILDPEPADVTGAVSHVRCHGETSGQISLSLPNDHQPYDIFWDGGQSDSLLTNLQVGDYAVTVIDGSGCTQELAFNIGQPDSMMLDPMVAELSCLNSNDAGINANLSGGSQPYSYLWSTGETNSEIAGLGAGTYSILVIDSNNCSISDTYNILNPPVINPVVEVIQPDCIKTQGTIILHEDNIYNYSYVVNGQILSADSIINNLDTGNYQIAYQISPSCLIPIDNVQITSPNLDFSMTTPSNEIEFTLGQEVTISVDLFGLSSGYVIEWTAQDSIICLATDDEGQCILFSIQPTNEQTVMITLTNDEGCVVSQNILLKLIIEEIMVFIPNVFSPNDDGVNDCFLLYSDNQIAYVLNFFIFDRWGERIYYENNIAFQDFRGWDGKANGAFVNPSIFVYLIELQLINGTREVFKGDLTVMR